MKDSENSIVLTSSDYGFKAVYDDVPHDILMTITGILALDHGLYPRREELENG